MGSQTEQTQSVTVSHPLIYMRGVKSDDMVALVNFLYYGETKVFQDNLDSFLSIAEELQLKGLNPNQSERELLHTESVPVKAEIQGGRSKDIGDKKSRKRRNNI